MANPRTIAKLEARIHERVSYCLQFEVSDPRALESLLGRPLTPLEEALDAAVRD